LVYNKDNLSKSHQNQIVGQWSNLLQFGSIWTSLVHFGPLWTILAQIGQL
jgi:hypothetical protein